MAEWSNRSPIPATMLNPALLATVIAAAADGYEREANASMPWPLSFVIAPLILHRGTRDALPAAISSHLHVWVSRHPVVRAGFPLRAVALRDPVREGLRFGLRHGLLTIEQGGLQSDGQRLRFDDVGDIRQVMRKATFVGRWLSRVDQTSTVFALLGVTT